MEDTAEFNVEILFKYLMRDHFRSYEYYNEKLSFQDKIMFIKIVINDYNTDYRGFTYSDPYRLSAEKAKEFLFRFRDPRIKGNLIISPITYSTQLSDAEFRFMMGDHMESIADEYVLYQNNGLRGIVLLRFDQIFEAEVDPYYIKESYETYGLPISIVCSFFEKQKLSLKQQAQIYLDVYEMLSQEQAQINP